MQASWNPVLLAAWMALAVSAGSARPADWRAQISQSPASTQTRAAATPVDINHATLRELMQVPGLTETWAARIVRFRPYRTKQDLLDRGVVTSQVYDRIRDSVIAHREKK